MYERKMLISSLTSTTFNNMYASKSANIDLKKKQNGIA